jgi:hypothetical protein
VGSEFAKSRDEGGIIALLSNIGHEVQEEVALADRIENLRRLQHLAYIGIH